MQGYDTPDPQHLYGMYMYKILRIKKREYRDGIKCKEARMGWGEAHNVRMCRYHRGVLNVKFVYKRGLTSTGNSHFSQFLCFAHMLSDREAQTKWRRTQHIASHTLHSGHMAC